MQANPITMQQISDELKLSRLTVSSVINGRARQRGISVATIQRVETHLRQRGYVPSRSAVALRTGKRSTIGILHCGSLYSHLTEAFSLMVDELTLKPDGIEIMVVRRQDLAAGMAELVARGIGSLIWIHATRSQIELAGEPTLLGFLANVPTVIYNYRFDEDGMEEQLESLGVHLVGISRKQGYERLSAHLRELGHREVVLPDVQNRVPGQPMDLLDRQFIDAFESAGMQVATAACPTYPSGNPRTDGENLVAAVRLAMRNQAVTAACFRDDAVAGFAMAHLMDNGVRIPEDLTVTGFDGLEIGEAFRAPLTTLRVPVKEMVACVCRILTAWSHPRCHCFDMDLVLRGSHGPARRSDNKHEVHGQTDFAAEESRLAATT